MHDPWPARPSRRLGIHSMPIRLNRSTVSEISSALYRSRVDEHTFGGRSGIARADIDRSCRITVLTASTCEIHSFLVSADTVIGPHIAAQRGCRSRPHGDAWSAKSTLSDSLKHPA